MLGIPVMEEQILRWAEGDTELLQWYFFFFFEVLNAHHYQKITANVGNSHCIAEQAVV